MDLFAAGERKTLGWELRWDHGELQPGQPAAGLGRLGGSIAGTLSREPCRTDAPGTGCSPFTDTGILAAMYSTGHGPPAETASSAPLGWSECYSARGALQESDGRRREAGGAGCPVGKSGSPGFAPSSQSCREGVRLPSPSLGQPFAVWLRALAVAAKQVCPLKHLPLLMAEPAAWEPRAPRL